MSDRNAFKIIIIDDNPSIHKDFIKILKTEAFNDLDDLSAEIFGNNKEKNQLPQFEIDTASQGQEGVERIKEALQQGKPYALAFVDIRMPPGWDGIETIKHIWEIDKDIQIVICTAYSDYSWEETIAHLGKTDNLLILKKPFDNISVRQLACALTTKWQLSGESRNYTNRLQQQVDDKTLSLQKSLALIKSTFESSSDGIIVISNDGTIIDYNNKLISMLQIPQDVINSKREESFINYLKTQLKEPEEFLSKIIELQRHPEETSIDVLKFNNENIFECYSQPHKQNNMIIGRILDFRNITKRAMLEQELQYQATHDSLTGLANRVELLQKMKFAIKCAAETNSLFAVLFIDFDRFKLINDSLSHMVGDELLKSAANRLQKAIRTEDTLARLGGDEFVIILMNIKQVSEIENKVNKLLEVFQTPFSIVDRQITLAASIGISIFPKDGTSVAVLLRNADSAMYRAKATKGNNYKFYESEMNTEALAILDQEMELRQAITHGEFFLCYQPQIDLQNDKLIAVEALLRWQHPQKGVLLPIDFIPLAEETGLIVQIGEWVMRTACAQNKAWQLAGFTPIRVAVNVTSQQFKQHNLIETVRTILQETNLDPKYLEIELTENVILSNREVIRVAVELKKLGVIIAIDDFGTGYTSLSYLHKIPLDRLKIDSSFIQHIQSSSDDEVIIRAVIAMAKNLNLEVLAEGVETVNQVNFLKKYNCDDVQGFYFSKPLTPSEIEKCLNNPEEIKEMTNHISDVK
jgi:diguanylate cyclase (GGDEF)-like protein